MKGIIIISAMGAIAAAAEFRVTYRYVPGALTHTLLINSTPQPFKTPVNTPLTPLPTLAIDEAAGYFDVPPTPGQTFAVQVCANDATPNETACSNVLTAAVPTWTQTPTSTGTKTVATTPSTNTATRTITSTPSVTPTGRQQLGFPANTNPPQTWDSGNSSFVYTVRVMNGTNPSSVLNCGHFLRNQSPTAKWSCGLYEPGMTGLLCHSPDVLIGILASPGEDVSIPLTTCPTLLPNTEYQLMFRYSEDSTSQANAALGVPGDTRKGGNTPFTAPWPADLSIYPPASDRANGYLMVQPFFPTPTLTSTTTTTSTATRTVTPTNTKKKMNTPKLNDVRENR